MLRAKGYILEIVFQDNKRISLQMEDGMHEKVQPSACSITAVRHTTGLLFGWKKELVKLAVLRGLDASHMTGHSYHATPRSERMLVPGEMEPTRAGSTQEMQNLLLHKI
jgi:hypothetical protein